MIFKIGKFRTCLKMKRSPRRKGQRKKNCRKNSVLDKEDTFGWINNMDNIILSKCLNVLYFTDISYYKYTYMLYTFVTIFLYPANQTFLKLHFIFS